MVIHTGINDALAYADLNNYTYQPDYHTFKKPMRPLPQITPFLRSISKSYIASSVLAATLFKPQLQQSFTDNDFLFYHNKNIWFKGGNDSMLLPQYNAFYNNVSELVGSIVRAKKMCYW